MWAPAAATAQTRDMTAESGTTLGIRTKMASTMMTMSSPWAKARRMATDGQEGNTDTRRHRATDARRHKTTDTCRHKTTNIRHRRSTTTGETEATGTTLVKVALKVGKAQENTTTAAKGVLALGGAQNLMLNSAILLPISHSR